MEILQNHLPDSPNLFRLPGTRPVGGDEWIARDEVFASQMALRDRLISERRNEVLRVKDAALPAAKELLSELIALLRTRPGYQVRDALVVRPDGIAVDCAADGPMATAGRLVQEDLCLLQKGADGEHHLTAAILCFPASWSLDDKFDKPLTHIHAPIDDYDATMGKRVQRMFDAIRPGAPLARENLLAYETADLFSPRTVTARRERPEVATFLRSERQCLVKLPKTDAVVFSIHSYVVRTADLDADQRERAREFIGSEVIFPR